MYITVRTKTYNRLERTRTRGPTAIAADFEQIDMMIKPQAVPMANIKRTITPFLPERH